MLFNFLDHNSNGLIDALELFILLSLFSSSRVEDRLRFIFDLFDFNERGYLEELDLQFIFFICLQGICKFFKLDSENPDLDGSNGHEIYVELNKLVES